MTPACDHTGALRRLCTSVRLTNDLDLDVLSERYGGLDSREHDGVQTLIALARELRTIERGLRHTERTPAR